MPRPQVFTPALLLLSLACAGSRPTTDAPSMPHDSCCAIVELRQYTLKPGQRDTLVDLFEREFIESQEAVGMPIPGEFRDLDRPERFVWLRGFSDMASRHQGLTTFYGGPVWKANRETANGTMLDSSNVLLLKPSRPDSGFGHPLGERPPKGATAIPPSVVLATVYSFDAPVDEDFVRFFENELKPALAEAGLPVSAYFQTDDSPNTFTPLPVREGEHVFVWFSGAPSAEALQERLSRLTASQAWSARVEPELKRRLKSAPEVLRLSPGARSRLRE
ncbi:NIPSNAP family protein [Pyxidicoccus sp. MSG2]|uniref:NIPSNAP family protein n=1 Tax=Pyxidicoccus sp. MSG2 TaxID=2996790 RepID=UPI002271E764|nr:NIPSNAP family protein [Pyxidicoccus sp. MSG2]MCY1019976.1 NIPSNAP family protein [Pyxidicoccus sp. MSG2]